MIFLFYLFGDFFIWYCEIIFDLFWFFWNFDYCGMFVFNDSLFGEYREINRGWVN